MKSVLLSICFLLIVSSSYPQSRDTLSIKYFEQGLAALSRKDSETAKDLFKKSVREEANAPAEYELARIYMQDTTHTQWNISREHIKNAVKLDPTNITYRLFYGRLSEALYNMSRIEFNAQDDAIHQYEKILELDSSNVYASNRLGELKSGEFLEFNNSIEKFSDGKDPLSSFKDQLGVNRTDRFKKKKRIFATIDNVQKVYSNRDLGNIRQQQFFDLQKINFADLNNMAEEDFNYAVKSLLNTIKYDSLNPKAYLTLGIIYDENKEPEKAVRYLQRLTRLLPDNKDAHLELGLLYYRTNQMDSAYSEYQKSISLMSDSERQDFTFNSVKLLLAPLLGKKMQDISDNTLKKVISIFWKARDPLNITPYNERLLAHYTRVAYSNLRFSVPKLNIKGWKTDRGITVIRYGVPPKKIRFRPGMGDGFKTSGNVDLAKTEVWLYNDKAFSFTDEFRNGNFTYAKPTNTQYFGDSQEFAQDLLATQPEAYSPEFEGPPINVPYKVVQLNNPVRSELTDVFVCYGIKPETNLDNNTDLIYKHSYGIFLFDPYFNKLAAREDSVGSISRLNKIEVPDSGDIYVNTEELIARPDSGNMSFEILRNSDNGVASYHGHYKIKSFNSKNLNISDIILASDIERESKVKGRISRKGYSILPNPTGIFNSDNNLFIYYEIYNLDKGEKGLTDFKQDIILQEKDDKGILGEIFSPILKFIGIDDNKKQVSLSSNYQTKDKDSQVYLQLDMSDYEPGNYVLTVKIKDNITGRETEQSTELTWK